MNGAVDPENKNTNSWKTTAAALQHDVLGRDAANTRVPNQAEVGHEDEGPTRLDGIKILLSVFSWFVVAWRV